MARHRAAVVLALVLVLSGCAAPVAREAEPAADLSLAQVLAAHNAWADRIPHLVGSGRVKVSLPGETCDKRETHDVDANLLMAKPDRLVLRGRVLNQEMFRVGMNAEKYWLHVGPLKTVWVGMRGGLGESRLVLRPSHVMASLGCFRIAPSPDRAMRLIGGRGHYVVCEEEAAAGGAVPVRRVWFDRATLRPTRIDLFGPGGRLVLMAELLEYKGVDGVDVCRAYRLRSYGDGEEVGLVLRL